MDIERHDEGQYTCPLGRFFQDLERISGRKSAFFRHMTQSRVEFLKAVRSLIDARIEEIEKKAPAGEEKRAEKIEVE
ncbi:MAG: hypothetical protein ACOWYE_10375 [Desulfatiglandales bacterium]